MKKKTTVHAEEGQQGMTITREFDLPLELLFKAYTEAEFIAQWMNTTVQKLESRKHGSYHFTTSDAKGNIAFHATGVIHEMIANEKIVRTFEMEGSGFGVQLEIYEFVSLSDATSRLSMQVIYETAAQRDQVLKLPFAQGINMAHNRLEEIMTHA